MGLVPANSHSPIFLAQRTLTTAQIEDLGSTPVVVVPALIGKTLVPTGGAFEYIAGTVGFGAAAVIKLGFDGGEDNFLHSASIALDGTTDAASNFLSDSPAALTPEAQLEISTSDPVGGTGSLATATVDAGGLLYANGDTGVVVNPNVGGTNGTYTVLTSAAGVVATVSVAGGTGFKVGDTCTTTVTTGTGDGNLTLVVDTINSLSDGTARVTVYYGIV